MRSQAHSIKADNLGFRAALSRVEVALTRKTRILLYGVVFVAGLAWMAYLFVNSPGVPVHDELTHFLISRNAWNTPLLMLNVWGRPANTIVYMIPSLAGLDGARAFSIALSALTVLLATKVAQKLGVSRLFLVPLFLWFQPWFNDLSYTALTEVPFSFFLILGIFLWLSEHEDLASISFGLLPLTRHEGIVLAAAWSAYKLYGGKRAAAVLAFVPLAGYNLAYYAVYHAWAADVFLSPNPSSIYGSGSWTYYLQPVAQAVGLPVVILSLLSLIAAVKIRKYALMVAAYAIYFLVHTVLFRFGLYASGGYYLFLLPMAPGFAVGAAIGAELAFRGLTHLASRIGSDANFGKALATIVLVACSAVALHTGLQTRPRPMDGEGVTLQQVARWIRDNHLSTHPIVAVHPWFIYLYDLPWPPPSELSPPFSTTQMNQMSPGTIIVWEGHYSDRYGLSREVLANPANRWQTLTEFGDGNVVLFERE